MVPLALWALLPTAQACGGFFCSGSATPPTTTTTTTTTGVVTYEAPVTQKSERILFQVDGSGTVTTFVEVSYIQNEDVDFAWMIPLPAAIRAEDVTTASADLFNALEEATAPRFLFRWEEVNQNSNPPTGTYGGYGRNYTRQGGFSSSSRGCGCADFGAGYNLGKPPDTTIPTDLCADFSEPPCISTGGTTTMVEEEVAVTVIDEAVVGPFAIEVVVASDTDQFATWLDDNGYDLPPNALGPLGHYVDMPNKPKTGTGEYAPAAFLGVRLAPDVPEGPIDTLVFSYQAERPMIPLILTAIATCPDLPVITYILGDEPWVPGNWAQADDPAPDTRPTSTGVDYNQRLDAELDTHGGHAFVTEYRDRTGLLQLPDTELAALIRDGGTVLTRLRGSVSPEEMTLDPEFIPDPKGEMVSNEHEIWLDEPPDFTERSTTDTGGGGAWLVLPLLGLLRRRRDRLGGRP